MNFLIGIGIIVLAMPTIQSIAINPLTGYYFISCSDSIVIYNPAAPQNYTIFGQGVSLGCKIAISPLTGNVIAACPSSAVLQFNAVDNFNTFTVLNGSCSSPQQVFVGSNGKRVRCCINGY
jgi:hypothetical protein